MSIITIKQPTGRMDPIQYVMSYFPDGQGKEENTRKHFQGGRPGQLLSVGASKDLKNP